MSFVGPRRAMSSQKSHIRQMTTNVRKHHTTRIFQTKFLSKMLRKIQQLLRNNTTNRLLCDFYGHYFFQSGMIESLLSSSIYNNLVVILLFVFSPFSSLFVICMLDCKFLVSGQVFRRIMTQIDIRLQSETLTKATRMAAEAQRTSLVCKVKSCFSRRKDAIRLFR